MDIMTIIGMPKKEVGASKIRLSPSAAIAAFICAFFITDVRIGGTLSPFAVSLAAALEPLYGLAALGGSLAASLISYDFWGCITELAAAAVMVLYRFLFVKKSSVRMSAAAAGIVYFICSCAAAAGSGDWVLFLAVFFRSLMCSAMTVCMNECVHIIRSGYYSEKDDELKTVSAAAVYMLIITALCARELSFINIGRIAAGFVISAAARKFGVQGGAAVGILSAAAFLLAEPSLGRSGAMLAFAGLAAGMLQPKGKYAVNIAFICSAFAVTAAAGMPSGTPAFIADSGIAAAIYCLVPERLYLPLLNGICAKNSRENDIRGDRIAFAAEAIEEVGSDAYRASEMLIESAGKRRNDIALAVKNQVCKELCFQGRCSAAGCGHSELPPDSLFRAAQSIAEKTGRITVKELPTGFEGCTKKTQIADRCSYAVELEKYRTRKKNGARGLLDSASQQLDASCGLLLSAASGELSGSKDDPVLSACARKMLEKSGMKVRSLCVYYDKDMNLFTEAFVSSEESISRTLLTEATLMLSGMFGCELEQAEEFAAGTGDDSVTRLRWHSVPKYTVDCAVRLCPGENGICGDSSVDFRDGRGNFYLIISDGMGRGGRAAAQSGMAVTMLRRLILSGADCENAVKTLSTLMVPSADEVFTTLDILKINCFTGKCFMLKLGAAATAVSSRDDEGAVTTEYKTVCSAPLGILGDPETEPIEFYMNESSRTVMMTDGVDISCRGFIDAVMENEKFTAEQIAEKIAAYADENPGESGGDDITCAAVRLYTNHH